MMTSSPAFSYLIQLNRFWLTLAETAIASATVVAARIPIIENAFRDPKSADLPELFLMSSEKALAFQKGQEASWTAALAFQRSLFALATDLMATGTRGGLLSSRDIDRLTGRWTTVSRAALDASTLFLAPYHRKATANSRRLEASPLDRRRA